MSGTRRSSWLRSARSVIEAKGNIVDHEFEFKRGDDNVAEVSKPWFRVRDTSGVEVAPGQDDALRAAAMSAREADRPADGC